MRVCARYQCAALAALLALGTGPASAGPQSFTISAEVVEGCALIGSSQSSGVDFGTLNYGTYPAVYSGQVNASVSATAGGPMRVECTSGLELQMSVDAGQHAVEGQRRLGLNGGEGFVPYTLFTGPGHTTPVPVSTSVAIAIPASGSIDLPLFGVAVLPGSGLQPGAYTDRLQITLAW